MSRKVGIVCSMIMSSLVLVSSMLTASERPIEKQRAETFLKGLHPRLGKESPAQRLPREIAQTILKYTVEESINITLVNNLEPSVYIRIRQVIPGQEPQNWPAVWNGTLPSGAYSRIGQPAQNYAQVTLPINRLRMGIAIGTPPHQTIYYVFLEEEDLHALRNNNVERLTIKRLDNAFYSLAAEITRPAYYRLTGWRRISVITEDQWPSWGMVWEKEGVPQVQETTSVPQP